VRAGENWRGQNGTGENKTGEECMRQEDERVGGNKEMVGESACGTGKGTPFVWTFRIKV